MVLAFAVSKLSLNKSEHIFVRFFWGDGKKLNGRKGGGFPPFFCAVDGVSSLSLVDKVGGTPPFLAGEVGVAWWIKMQKT